MKQIQGNPLPLGVTVVENKINFSVEVPEGAECNLLLYHPGKTTPFAEYPMTESAGEVRCLALEVTESRNYEYNYLINGEVKIDPYAKALAGKLRWGTKGDIKKHEVRGIVYCEEYDWEGDVPLNLPYHEVVAYSLHVRGFTKDPASKVRKKGTFEGVIEKLEYLRDLGVNQIQCMPVYEFEECGLYCNYWGYGEGYFFAPKSAYSACGDAVKSLKDMVKAFHKAGIEVVLEMPFHDSFPKILMEECLRYYMMEYHIDGFIVNPALAPMDGICHDPILKKTKIMHHDTAFQNVMRRALKGDEGIVPDLIYWLRHLSQNDGIFNYITGHTGFTLNDLVSYDRKHNESNGENNQDGPDYNFSWNCGAEGPSRKKEIQKLRKRQVRNAFLLTLLAQGTPCILAGDEFGNSQKGNNNVYCQDNPIGWVNWRRLTKEEELHDFVRKAIEIRRKYPVFSPEREMRGMDKTGCGVPDVSYHGESAWRVQSEVPSRQLGVYYSEVTGKNPDVYVAYNMHWLDHTFALPALTNGKKWYVIFSTDDVGASEKPVKNSKFMEVAARTIVALVGR